MIASTMVYARAAMSMLENDPQDLDSDAQRWDAIVRRDRQADGVFWYGVATTGIYCRPGCASRQPSRENVRFFASPDQAEQAGFRACKRCQPRAAGEREHQVDAVRQACRLIETADVEPSLDELAAAVGFSPSHLHRLFKEVTRVTPKQYAMAQRARRVRDRLPKDSTVTEAMFNAGYASASAFYATQADTLGMTPAQYRGGAAGQVIRYAAAPCYLGWVLVAATERGICAIDFGDTPAALEAGLRGRFPKATLHGEDAEFGAWIAQVVAFLEAPGRGLNLPLDVQGTAFQRRVWSALRQIPPGATVSYGALAAQLGNPKASRAVAQACASNTLAVAIPCHRVVRANGELGGYRWGLERKQALLSREAESS